jgi:hypothetical protein
MRMAPGNSCCYGSKYILKSRTESRSSTIKRNITLKPAVMQVCQTGCINEKDEVTYVQHDGEETLGEAVWTSNQPGHGMGELYKTTDLVADTDRGRLG